MNSVWEKANEQIVTEAMRAFTLTMINLSLHLQTWEAQMLTANLRGQSTIDLDAEAVGILAEKIRMEQEFFALSDTFVLLGYSEHAESLETLMKEKGWLA